MAQSLSKLYIHIIFSTKNRYPFFDDETLRSESYKYIASILTQNETYPIIINGTANHIHIFCNLSKKFALTETIGTVKRSSSQWLKSKGGIFEKFYWQRGYGAFSVSESSRIDLINYIKNQQNHHKKITFKEELLKFLEKYNMDYNEKYLWD